MCIYLFIDTENKLVVARVEEGGGIGEGGQKVQTSGYKITTSWDVMYRRQLSLPAPCCIANNTVLRVGFKNFITRKKICNYVW